jgi:hypothetical protein
MAVVAAWHAAVGHYRLGCGRRKLGPRFGDGCRERGDDAGGDGSAQRSNRQAEQEWTQDEWNDEGATANESPGAIPFEPEAQALDCHA